MLTREQNERLTRVGAGTPMGELLRRYWHPVAAVSEFGKFPLPRKLLGEEIVVYRDLDGNFGAIEPRCPHRGASLALACDVVLASEKAFFMLAFTKIALMPDGGASALVAAAVGRIRAMRMALLAERIPAREAFDWGLVTAVYPDDTFDAEVDKVLATLVSGPAVALRKTKEAINAATLTELEGAFEREMVGQSALIRSDDFKEGTLAFQQRRSATFTDT